MTGADAPVLTLGGKSFRCVPHVGEWRLMKLAKAMTGDDMVALAGMYDFLQALVDPAVWSDFDAHMNTLDLGRSDLDTAIGDTLVQMAGRGKGSGESSTPSSGGSPNPATPPMSRVVSLSKGTVRPDIVLPSLSDAATSSTG